jgi:hypothetical protein
MIKSLIKSRKMEIEPIHIDCNDCLDDQLLSVASWIRKDVPKENLAWHFGECWKFSFSNPVNDSKGALGKVLYENNSYEYDSYKKYYGVEIKYHHEKKLDEFFDGLQKELYYERPVVLIQKSYWIPWDINYQINNEYTHAYIITDVDYDNKNLIATDGYYSQKDILIDFSHVEKGFIGEFITFSYSNDMDRLCGKISDWKSLLRHTLKNVKDNKGNFNAFSDMRDLAERLMLIDDINSENNPGDENFVSSKLYRAISIIINSRKKFARFMKHLERKTGIEMLCNMCKEFELSANKWLKIQHLMLKASIAGNYSAIKPKLYANIIEVAELEESIFVEMEGFVEEYNDHSQKNNEYMNKTSFDDYEKYIFLDLESYFNTKGFGDAEEDSCPTLIFSGQYFSNENIPLDEVLIVDDMKFKFPEVKKHKLDSLYCKGQVITTEREKYNTIMFLGFSDTDNFSDEVEIEYTDNSVEKLMVAFTCWYINPHFGDMLAWEGSIFEKNLDGTAMQSSHKYKIFANKYSFNCSDKVVKSIRLPECENIHIFAITAAKDKTV